MYKLNRPLPKDIRETRAKLFPYPMEKKEQRLRATIRYDKLLVEGKLFTLQELSDENKDKTTKRQRSTESDSPSMKPKKKGEDKFKLRESSLDRFLKQDTPQTPRSSHDQKQTKSLNQNQI